jgi:Tol biopolymer transport system component
MGEVYRARDPRLGRDVAVKVLPSGFSGDADRLRRFEQEARAAAALNHPNILAVHDIGSDGGVTYIVSELLVGSTLRKMLGHGGLPLRKAIDYGIQIANGMAAAHDRGIVHRDLKPENVFVTDDGNVKLLDFGLAKLNEPAALAGVTYLPTTPAATQPGLILGTVGYMAPEQARGEPSDARADIFAFGALFYEMLCGRRAFSAPSAIETMSAVVTKHPIALGASGVFVSPVIERILDHCLEKRPEARFQSARDLAFALEALDTSSGPRPVPVRSVVRRNVLRAVAATAVLAAAVGAGAWMSSRTRARPVPSFRQMTFQRGTVWSARFAPDGRTIVYSAAWHGQPLQLFTTRTDTSESRPLDLTEAKLLATSSSSGEMAILMGPNLTSPLSPGTLARASLVGGAAREVLDGVFDADMSADGSTFAVVRASATGQRLEFPIGRPLYETSGYVSNLRISPRGNAVAFMDHEVFGDDRGSVAVVDLSGHKKTLTQVWTNEWGLAWAPDGSEIWFTAASSDGTRPLYGVNMAGSVRLVYRAPDTLKLEDISREGNALLSREYIRREIVGLIRGDERERDFSWFSNQSVRALSADGTTLIFEQYGAGSGPDYTTYLRRTDRASAIRLGDGSAQSLSPDGKWVIVALFSAPDRLVLLPTGAGESKVVTLGPVRVDGSVIAHWLPDSRHIAFGGIEPGHVVRSYIVDSRGGVPRAVSPEGVVGTLVSPDGQRLAAIGPDGKALIVTIRDGIPHPLPSVLPGETFTNWDASGEAVFVHRRTDVPLTIFRVDLATGHRTAWKQIAPADTAGMSTFRDVLITPDGRSYAYDVERNLSDLYLTTGLK